MQKGDDIRKIGLVIADKQNIPLWQPPQMLRTGDPEPVDNHQSGIGHHPHDGIYQLPDETEIRKTLAEAHVNVGADYARLPNVRLELRETKSTHLITFTPMQLNTVIFDMDGLLIDSEPWWQIAGTETLREFNVTLSPIQYHHTTGLRTPEWLDYWFGFFGIDKKLIPAAAAALHANVFEKIRNEAEPLPGVRYALDFFRAKQFRIGLATSSPLSLAKIVTDKLDIGDYFNAITSAGDLPYGKPHPQVYIDCAAALSASPLECLAFEDSFNGLIAAKAARMKCVVIPVADQFSLPKWGAADLKLSSLTEFTGEHLNNLQ
jgi:sugar-phosphatase